MKIELIRFLIDDDGQDLTEYTLLIVFVLLAIVGLASGYSNSIAGVAGLTNSNLAAAGTAAS